MPLGFTLIEILVVILIISIVACVATLTIHVNEQREIKTFSNQLTTVIHSAEEEAMLRPAILGMGITEHDVSFYEFNEINKTWQVTSQPIFKPKKFPGDMLATLQIENKLIPSDGQPHLIISNNGDTPNFIITLGNHRQNKIAEVIGEASGNVFTR